MSAPKYQASANAYATRRRSEAVARGDCTICWKRPKLPDRVRCRECNEVQRRLNRSARVASTTYTPIDEIMDKPRIRMLRQLRHHDWITSCGLFDALDLPQHERNKYTAALAYGQRHGTVERRDLAHGTEYRITALGLAALRGTFNDYEQRLGEGVAA